MATLISTHFSPNQFHLSINCSYTTHPISSVSCCGYQFGFDFLEICKLQIREEAGMKHRMKQETTFSRFVRSTLSVHKYVGINLSGEDRENEQRSKDEIIQAQCITVQRQCRYNVLVELNYFHFTSFVAEEFLTSFVLVVHSFGLPTLLSILC